MLLGNAAEHFGVIFDSVILLEPHMSILKTRWWRLGGNLYAICTQSFIYLWASIHLYDFISLLGYMWWKSWTHYLRCFIMNGVLYIYFNLSSGYQTPTAIEFTDFNNNISNWIGLLHLYLCLHIANCWLYIAWSSWYIFICWPSPICFSANPCKTIPPQLVSAVAWLYYSFVYMPPSLSYTCRMSHC